MEKIKVMSVFGTRPEATKMAPLIKQMEECENIESKVAVTAQHRNMLDQVLDLFDIKPDYDLNIMKDRQTLTETTINALKGLEDVIKKDRPDLLLVHGDTTTTFAASLAAYYNKVKLGHVEAGLRTFDKYQPYPEEMNRKLTGALADLNFSPTENSKLNLIREGHDEKTIFVTGNTAIDLVGLTVSDDYTFSEKVLNKINFSKRVITMTAHRGENIGEPLENICKSVLQICEEYNDIIFIYPVHKNPAVRDIVNKYLTNNDKIILTDTVDFKDLSNLMARSYLVLTDSGGLQEEASALHKPVIVLRNTTERPEGLEANTLKLAGTQIPGIVSHLRLLLDSSETYKSMAAAKNPFGDGLASKRIVNAILYYFGITKQPPESFK